MSKIVIGTANFNSSYGFENHQISKKNISQIILLAKKDRIKYFDTAIDYSIKKNFFQLKDLKNLKIITKFRIPTKNSIKFVKNFEDEIIKHIKFIGVNKLEGLLFHSVKDIKNKNFNHIINKIKSLKKKKIVNKFGFSVYDPKEIKSILSKIKPDIIQAPLNLFDQRILKKDFLKILKKDNIELHVRSIFLQGSLVSSLNLLKKSKLPVKLVEKIIKFEKFCQKNNATRLEICCNFINRIKKIDKIVIGSKSIKQLNKIICLLKTRKISNSNFNYDKFQEHNLKIIDPRKWKKTKKKLL